MTLWFNKVQKTKSLNLIVSRRGKRVIQMLLVLIHISLSGKTFRNGS